MNPKQVFVTRLTLRNYKSIAACRLSLGPLTFLVGPNGSGKSNCLDSLRLVAESLRTSLDHALRDRGTIKEVRRRSGGHPNHFAVRVDFTLPSGATGHYSFQVAAKESGGFEVQIEECRFIDLAAGLGEHFYRVERGHVVRSSLALAPAAFPDRLYLVAASGLADFRPLYDALSGMEIYNLNPKEIAAMQKPDAGELLRRDGSNAASVFQKLPAEANARVNFYLARIVKGVADAETKTLAALETVEFRQAVKGQKHPWRFYAASMSDGTLRGFGILLALFHTTTGRPGAPVLIGLEEPEMALHPAASAILLAALREASAATQILVTSHSPDLLDEMTIPAEAILAVDNSDGVTQIAPIDEAGRSVLKEKLFTPGELLRQNQLAPDPNAIKALEDDRQLPLFELNSR
ncbi:MAG: AAA family ATPase [Verrucomicrobiota bacterium]|nr:AAA family ATPase [Verrucomicrobiota bacterium]